MLRLNSRCAIVRRRRQLDPLFAPSILPGAVAGAVRGAAGAGGCGVLLASALALDVSLLVTRPPAYLLRPGQDRPLFSLATRFARSRGSGSLWLFRSLRRDGAGEAAARFSLGAGFSPIRRFTPSTSRFFHVRRRCPWAMLASTPSFSSQHFQVDFFRLQHDDRFTPPKRVACLLEPAAIVASNQPTRLNPVRQC